MRALALHLRVFKREDTAWLLVVDPFEGLYTLADEAQCGAFDALPAHALQDAECPLFLVSTVRSEFAHRITERLPRLAALINSGCTRFLLPQITPPGLRQITEVPALLAQVDVSQVSTAMQRDAEGEPGALPLVQNALRVLWHEAAQQRSPDGRRVLSGQVYQDSGGLAGLLATEADSLLEHCERKHICGRKAALELLLRLTHISRDGRHTRQQITREEAIAAAGQGNRALGETVLHLLAGARDLDRPADASAENPAAVVTSSERGQDHVDLIHETLLRRRPSWQPLAVPAGGPGLAAQAQGYWPTLLKYVEDNRDRPGLQAELNRKVEKFESAPRFWRWRQRCGWIAMTFRQPSRSRCLRPLVVRTVEANLRSGMDVAAGPAR